MSDLAVIFYKTVKHNSTCLICGSARDLQFHHVCPRDKIDEINKVARSNELAAVISELNKCVPLCDMDHRAVHKGLRKGWLKGAFDNGKASNGIEAMVHMPYLNWLFRQKPDVLSAFYRDTIERDQAAIHELMAVTGIPSPLLERVR